MDEQLVNQVVQRVLEALKRQEAPGSPAPVGLPGQADSAPSDAASPAPAPRPGRVWLTAEDLAGRARGGSGVVIGMNEHLTPAARDYAGQRHIEVRRDAADGSRFPHQAPTAAPPASAPRGIQPAALTKTIGLVVARADAKVEAVLSAAARLGVTTVAFADSTCPIANARAMCGQILAGRLAGGVAIDRYAAAAMIVAAKIRGIRPVQGVSPAAVEAGLRQFDANVLVVGYETVSVYEFRSMLVRFAAGRRMGRDRTSLLDAVEQLEAGG